MAKRTNAESFMEITWAVITVGDHVYLMHGNHNSICPAPPVADWLNVGLDRMPGTVSWDIVCMVFLQIMVCGRIIFTSKSNGTVNKISLWMTVGGNSPLTTGVLQVLCYLGYCWPSVLLLRWALLPSHLLCS